MRSEDARRRNETVKAQIAERPIAAWLVHAVAFVAFALLLQVVRGTSIDWLRAVTAGAVVAAAVVGATVFGYRRGRRAQGESALDAELYEWMEPTIEAVRPCCDEPVIAAGTFQVAGGWASGISSGLLFSGLFRRPPKHVRERSGACRTP